MLQREAEALGPYWAADDAVTSDAGATELAVVAGAVVDGATVVPLSAGAVVAGAAGVTAVPLSTGAIGVVVVSAGAIGVVVVSAGAAGVTGVVTAGVLLISTVLVEGCEFAEKTK